MTGRRSYPWPCSSPLLAASAPCRRPPLTRSQATASQPSLSWLRLVCGSGPWSAHSFLSTLCSACGCHSQQDIMKMKHLLCESSKIDTDCLILLGVTTYASFWAIFWAISLYLASTSIGLISRRRRSADTCFYMRARSLFTCCRSNSAIVGKAALLPSAACTCNKPQ